ncbi:MAG: aromatic amino acid transport family protein [Candidatus Portnoybacteria bacterium]|jgi:tyrosine-specific transport protein|nr:aromatic amino acid transport family protein [Candidatus Portnoybacteria bacterium]
MADKSPRQFFYAVAALIGMIVGAGTFGLPYIAAQSGFWLSFFYLSLLGLAALLVHLIYGEIVLRTDGQHRLVGYAEKYLGKRAKVAATSILLFEYYGALLVYLILGGSFLKSIFGFFWSGAPVWFWPLVFFLLGIGAIIGGLKSFERSEFLMSGLLLLAVAALAVKGWPQVSLNNFSATVWPKFFLPYGVFLFALAGSAAIPEIRHILRGQERKISRAIFWGTVIPIVLYFLFIFVVVGISGPATTESAFEGLAPYLGREIIYFGAVFGLLAVFTSFLVLGWSLKNVFDKDYKIKKTWGYFLVFSVPLLAYFSGLRDFIFVVGLVGAVASGLDGLLTVLIFLRARKTGDRRPEYRLPLARPIAGFLMIIFILGLTYQFIYLSVK